jgi:tRNA pseudouridine38-40 synthase
MPRLAAGVEYHGSAYAGWQAQASLTTIQSFVENAFAAVANSPVSVVCAGRTDAGVHARGQILHFDTDVVRSLRGWTLGANSHLPRDISIAWVRPVPAHFHARYSAEARTYRYFIFNRPVRSALAEGKAAQIHRPLELARMQAAAPALVGEHDFSAFRSAECQAKSPVRRLTALSVERDGDWVTIEVTANAFLHHMMRNIAGLLIAIGRGDEEPEWAEQVLRGRDRTLGAATAPPEGLYLWSVAYPAAFGLPDVRSAIIVRPPGVQA